MKTHLRTLFCSLALLLSVAANATITIESIKSSLYNNAGAYWNSSWNNQLYVRCIADEPNDGGNVTVWCKAWYYNTNGQPKDIFLKRSYPYLNAPADLEIDLTSNLTNPDYTKGMRFLVFVDNERSIPAEGESEVTFEYAAYHMYVDKDVKWGSFVAAQDVQIPEGVFAYTLSKTENNNAALTTLSGTSIPANTPVILYAENGVDKYYNYAYNGFPKKDIATGSNMTGLLKDNVTIPEGSYVFKSSTASGAPIFQKAANAKTGNKNDIYLTLSATADQLHIERNNVITYKAGSNTGNYNDGTEATSFGTGLKVISHTFNEGEGAITFSGDVTSIPEDAFVNRSNLTSISIPNSVTSIGNHAFRDCSSLASISIPNGVTSIGYAAFCRCNFTSISIPNGVTSIEDGLFLECSNLADISIPNGVTSIGVSAFKNCSNLTSISIPNGVTSIGVSAFYGCSNLTSISIPNGVTSIGEYAFSECSNLTSISIPNGVTSIGGSAFKNCSNLTSISIPNSVTSIGNHAFSNCNTLTSIVIPNSVKSIGECLLEYCNSLSDVTFGEGIESIEKSIFNNCENIKNVTFGHSFKLLQSEIKPCSEQLITFKSIPYVGEGCIDSGTKIALSLTDDSYIYVGSNPVMENDLKDNILQDEGPVYTREIKAKWNTVCFPFETRYQHFYTISSFENGIITLQHSEELEAGHPALMYTEDVPEMSIYYDGNLKTELANASGTNRLVGTFTKTTIPASSDASHIYYGLSSNTGSLVKVTSDATIKPFRAYIECENTPVNANLRTSIADTEVTAISDVINALNSSDAEYYDINGIRHSGLRQGMNIIKANGKTQKVYVK